MQKEEIYINHVIGYYSKGNHTTENGHETLNFCLKNELFITNTKFKHKMSHRTSWSAPYRNFRNKKGEERKNPIYNTIDFIMINKMFLNFVTNARSYGGIRRETDHKLIKINTNFSFRKMKTQKLDKDKNHKINVENFANKDNITKYKEKVSEKERNSDFENNSAQKEWEQIVQICKESAEEVLGLKSDNQKNEKDDEIKLLKQKKYELKQKMENTNNDKAKREIRKERRKIKKGHKKENK